MKKKKYVQKIPIGESNIWRKRSPLLTKLDIELTERCNNDCLHCCVNLPVDDLRAKKKELSSEEIKTILKEAADLGCLRVRFTGGEPLLREDFEEIYIYARRLGLKVLLFTNATLISPHLIGLFSWIPLLEKIEITVYGMKKKSYESVTRTPGSFEAAWKGLTLLLENEIPFVVRYALLPQNKKDKQEFEKWVAGLPWMDKASLHSAFFDLRLRRDSQDKNHLIKSLRPTPEEGLKLVTQDSQRFEEEMKEFCANFIYPPGKKLFSCGAGIGSGCVDPYGFFSPCLLLKNKQTQYNLKKGSMKEALKNFFPEIREMKAKNLEYLSRCARCFLKGLCEQCPAKSWTEHGKLDVPIEYYCQLAHLQAVYLGLLKEGEKAWEVKNWQRRIQKLIRKDVSDKNNQQYAVASCDI